MNWLEKLIKEHGYKSIYAFEMKCGFAKNHLKKCIANDQPIDKYHLGNLKSIAKALGTTVYDLIKNN